MSILIKTNITLFLPSIERGGVERNFKWLLERLLIDGYDVTVVYCRDQFDVLSSLPFDVKKNKIPIFSIPYVNPRLSHGLSIVLYSLNWTKRYQWGDVILSFQSGIIAAIVSKILNRPLIVRLSNHPDASSYEDSIVRSLSEYLKTIILKRISGVISISEGVKDEFYKRSSINSTLIYNPVFLESSKKLASQNVSLPWKSNQILPLVVSIGRLVKQKDFGTLIDSISILQKKMNVRLVIVGDGPEYGQLKSKTIRLGLQDAIYFVGFQSNPYKYLAKADVFVQTPLYEGFGSVLIEAMSLKVPVLSTDCNSGPREILQDGKYGVLVPTGDSTAVAKNIYKIISQQSESKKIAEAAYESLSRFDEDLIYKNYIHQMESVLS
jgi:glycosyltransferase involved in cell wall biosynthesis